MHLMGGREITADYNQIFFHESDNERIAKLEMWTAKQIGTALVAHLPNRQWNVQVDAVGRMIVIMCPDLSLNHGYHMDMRQDTITGLVARAVRAGGEIMERFGLRTGKTFNPDTIETLDRTPNGEEALHSSAIGEDPLKR